MAAGIEVRHAEHCAAKDGRRCNCDKTYRASVWDNRSKKRIRKTFDSEAAAKEWRQGIQVALREGRLRAPTRRTVEQAAVEWLRDACDGIAHNRSGDRYKPSALRSYEQTLRLRVLPKIGTARISDVTISDLQELVDRLKRDGRHRPLSPPRSPRSGRCSPTRSRGGGWR